MRLTGECEPHLTLGMARAPVVGRLVLDDEAQLAHAGLEVGRAHDRIDAIGEAHHLGHAFALLGRGEVGAHAGAQVARRADVERVTLRVAEDVDAGSLGEGIGEVTLGALLRRRAAPEGDEVFQAEHAEWAHPLHEAVEDGHRGSRVIECAVARGSGRFEETREGLELAVAHLVARDGAARNACGVDDARPGPGQIGLVARPA